MEGVLLDVRRVETELSLGPEDSELPEAPYAPMIPFNTFHYLFNLVVHRYTDSIYHSDTFVD